MRIPSLASRIALAMAFFTASACILATFVTGYYVLRSNRAATELQLRTTLNNLLQEGFETVEPDGNPFEIERSIGKKLRQESLGKVFQVYDENGKEVFSNVNYPASSFEKFHLNKTSDGEFQLHEEYENTIASVAKRYVTKDTARTFWLRTSVVFPRRARILNVILDNFVFLFATIIVFTFPFSMWLSNRLLKPVRDIARIAEHVNPCELKVWTPMEVPSDGQYLGPIVSAFNALIGRSQRTVLRLQRMSRSIAHEVRTPLTILRGEAENLLLSTCVTEEDYKAHLRSTLDEVERLEKMVVTVLQLSKGDGLISQTRPKSTDLHDFLNDLRTQLGNSYGPIDWQVPEKGRYVALLDTNLFAILLDNLIRNAKRHATVDRRPEVSVDAEGPWVRVHIQDFGMGMSSDVLSALENDNEASLGIGLSICKEISRIGHYPFEAQNNSFGALMIAKASANFV